MTNTALFQAWYEEVWNKANENFITETLHPGAVIHGLQTDPGKTGLEAFLPFYKTFREQFPHVQTALTPIFSCDGFEAAECDVTATHANGKTVTFSGISIAKFIDGKLVEGWNGFDFLTMYQQLGFKLTE
jgi:predicted ester cyclase